MARLTHIETTVYTEICTSPLPSRSIIVEVLTQLQLSTEKAEFLLSAPDGAGKHISSSSIRLLENIPNIELNA